MAENRRTAHTRPVANQRSATGNGQALGPPPGGPEPPRHLRRLMDAVTDLEREDPTLAEDVRRAIEFERQDEVLAALAGNGNQGVPPIDAATLAALLAAVAAVPVSRTPSAE
jgi:hypothetical protein